jgi:hypothetical protein
MPQAQRGRAGPPSVVRRCRLTGVTHPKVRTAISTGVVGLPEKIDPISFAACATAPP